MSLTKVGFFLVIMIIGCTCAPHPTLDEENAESKPSGEFEDRSCKVLRQLEKIVKNI